MGRVLRLLWVPICVSALILAGCEAGDSGGDGDSAGDGGGDSGPCLIGATQACDCPGGFMGAQTCVPSGVPCDGSAEDEAENPCPEPGDPVAAAFEACICGDGEEGPLGIPGNCVPDAPILSVDSQGEACSHKPPSLWESVPNSHWGQSKYVQPGTGLECTNFAISQWCPDQMGAWTTIYCFGDCEEPPPPPEPCDGGWSCGDICLDQAQVCDGVLDCADGSDEGDPLCLPPCGDGVCALGYEDSIICPEDCDPDNPCAVLDALAPHVQDCGGVCLPEVMVGDGTCDPSFQCADLDWDGGDCVMCEEDAACDDGDPCNGQEICTGDLMCAPSDTPMDCDDGDATTVCVCDVGEGCSCETLACGDDEWKCSDGTQCVGKDTLCDESAECADGSDESEDLCAPECGDDVCSLLEAKGQAHFCIGDCVGKACGDAEGAVYDCAGECHGPGPSSEYGGGEPGDGLCHDDCPLEGLNAVLSGPFPFSDPDKVMLGVWGCHEYEAQQCWWFEDDPEEGPWEECFPDFGSFYGPDWNCSAFEWDGGDCLASCDPAEGCDDEDICNGAEACEALSDGQTVCVPGEALPCGDDVDCTVDFCDLEAQGCVQKPDHEACDDGDPTTTDTCDPVAGCSSEDLTCPPGFWECADGTGCIGSGDICDGSAECDDGSDEVVGCPTDEGCGEGFFQCAGRQVDQDQICIQDAQVCDGAFECDGKGIDESPDTCCGNGECVPQPGQGGYSQWSESCITCAEDCGVCAHVCGDGECVFPENPDSCADDCAAGDACGADGTLIFDCQGFCLGSAEMLGDGDCFPPMYCAETDWDGGDCADPASCGDGLCEEAEEDGVDGCFVDCDPGGELCGDGICDDAFPSPENCFTCPGDCGECVGDCCEPEAWGTQGCAASDCQVDVCEVDPYCCDNTWDKYCVDCAAGLPGWGGLDCTAVGQECGCSVGVCGDGSCNGEETCNNCFDDCGECLAPCDPAEGCDDGDVCNGSETCIPLVNGFHGCSSGEILDCDDEDPNTANSCDPTAGCSSAIIACEDGLWKCAAAAQCIPMDHVCDGQAQCDDGSDEAADPCSPPCGDGICDTYESWEECPEDCSTGSDCGVDGVVDCDGLSCAPTALLGDGECNSGFPFSPNLGLLCAELDWDGGDCASPDSCGDGICQPPEGTVLCPADCVAAACLLPNGDAGTFDCNGDCWSSDYLGDGTCHEGHKAYVSLGDDADGEPVISSIPTADFRCESFNWDEGDCAPMVCGDGICDGYETPSGCAEDCSIGDLCSVGPEEGVWDCDGWCSVGADLGDGVCHATLNCEELALDGGDCWTCPDDSCDDGNPCTDDGCDLNSGTCFHEANHWMPCDDGDGLDCTQGYCQQVPATPDGEVLCLNLDFVQSASDPASPPVYFTTEGSCALPIPGGQLDCFAAGDSHPALECYTCDPTFSSQEWAGLDNVCLFDGVTTYCPGVLNPDNPCEVCDPSADSDSPGAWMGDWGPLDCGADAVCHATGGCMSFGGCGAAGGNADWMSDGYCDESNSVVECAWDGGDCCQSTCEPGPTFNCGTTPGIDFVCNDPDAGECVPECEDKECGWEACGVGCGECEGDLLCNVWGKCIETDGCQANAFFISDGQCDASTNTAACNWDGGDCCESTCEPGPHWECGNVGPMSDGYNCQDPVALCAEADCADGTYCHPITGACLPYADCEAAGGNAGWMSDGYCDESNSVVECAWDGGDCCQSTCQPGPSFNCGNTPGVDFYCDDPAAGECVPECEDKECGWEACGVGCGECEGELVCNVWGKCIEADGCAANGIFISDGQCDAASNTAECNWDGGDCCATTCENGPHWECGQTGPNSDGYICLDPIAQCVEGICGEDAACHSTEGCMPVTDCSSAGGNAGWIGDGYCDESNSVVECAWDGGDCCQSTCQPGPSFNCGNTPGVDFHCNDPAAGECVPECEDKECGWEACGVGCGECEGDLVCNVWGKCIEADGCAASGIFISDGQCDAASNTAECNWDGGDCCESTCENGPHWECGQTGPNSDGYNCLDPDPAPGACGDGSQPNCAVEDPVCPPGQELVQAQGCGICVNPMNCVDMGAHCPPQTIRDCAGACQPEQNVGNGICNGEADPAGDFNCAASNWDEGDCGVKPLFCPDGELISCDGAAGQGGLPVWQCHPSSLGDENCDALLNCAEYGFDGGDCLQSCGGGLCEPACDDPTDPCETPESCPQDCSPGGQCVNSACPSGLCLVDCNGNCSDLPITGNGCDPAFDCPEWDFDGGDCAGGGPLWQLPFVGLASAGEGVVGFHATGGGPEPTKSGHSIPAPYSTCKIDQADPSVLPYNEQAYYYLASRDHIVAPPVEVGGAHLDFTQSTTGFPLFSGSIAAAGWPAQALVIRFGLMTLGDDVEGQDWTLDMASGEENRTYTGGTWSLLLGGHPIVGGPMPMLQLSVEYHPLADGTNLCLDDQLSAYTDLVPPVDIGSLTNAATPADVAAAAQAFIDDATANGGISMMFDSIQPAGQEEFSENGRIGGMFDVQQLSIH